MIALIKLTSSSDKPMWVNAAQLRIIAPMSSGNTQLVFDDEHVVVVREHFEEVATLARSFQSDPYC